MTAVYSRAQIAQVIHPREVIAAMERAFVAYSNGEAVIPPVGQLDFEDPPGDCHIKYGYLKQGSTFAIKIATGFWKNPERGLASSNGVVLVFSSETGELLTIFQDEGFLTDMRTADLVELGRVIQDASLRRRSEQDISIADLTGVAVQDMAIAELALQGLQSA